MKLITGYMNIYRSGFFHREGKPLAYPRHSGDFYATKEAALAQIDQPDYYVTTVPFTYFDPDDDLTTYPADSTPVPLSVSRARGVSV